MNYSIDAEVNEICQRYQLDIDLFKYELERTPHIYWVICGNTKNPYKTLACAEAATKVLILFNYSAHIQHMFPFDTVLMKLTA